MVYFVPIQTKLKFTQQFLVQTVNTNDGHNLLRTHLLHAPCTKNKSNTSRKFQCCSQTDR